jgi:outer membrane immunogenic protein
MKKILLAGIAAAAFCGAPALAAPPTAPMFNWTGFYVGVNGGYGGNWGDLGNNIVDFESVGATTTNVPVIAPNPKGGFGGGQIGYNMQFAPNWVWGVETDIQGSGIRGNSQTSFPGSAILAPLNISTSYKTDYFGTVRGRLGYTVDRTMAFITGGFAYGRSSYLAAATFSAGGFPGYNLMKTSTNTGYVVGGGVEQQLAGNWTFKAEYQYINLGSDSTSAVYFCCTTFNNTVKFDNILQTFRLGLNYKFGSR